MADPLQTYYRLRPGVGFLTGLQGGPMRGEGVENDFDLGELAKAEKRAKAHIDGFLGKRWGVTEDDLDDVPELIQEVAEKLASAFVLEIAERLEHGLDGNPADRLMQQADKTLRDIRQGRKGVQLQDGTWDVTYHGNNNPEEGKAGGLQILSM